jgi:hypothetical protein
MVFSMTLLHFINALCLVPECQGIPGQAQHPSVSPPVLIGFGLLKLIPLTQAGDHPEVEVIERPCSEYDVLTC